ncbi:hypothetical protein TRICI_006770 [Trichomonascus ciferrii]|uniref:Uncharacterized protein n=1 Tax=Trichomonascus ciferrii TaxID=44093 RepID=A0A642UDN6_9ASCO|nr:hypothetical protein TRICI_006770 [Trichomonascus ciferrii]
MKELDRVKSYMAKVKEAVDGRQKRNLTTPRRLRTRCRRCCHGTQPTAVSKSNEKLHVALNATHNQSSAKPDPGGLGACPQKGVQKILFGAVSTKGEGSPQNVVKRAHEFGTNVDLARNPIDKEAANRFIKSALAGNKDGNYLTKMTENNGDTATHKRLDDSDDDKEDKSNTKKRSNEDSDIEEVSPPKEQKKDQQKPKKKKKPKSKK